MHTQQFARTKLAISGEVRVLICQQGAIDQEMSMPLRAVGSSYDAEVSATIAVFGRPYLTWSESCSLDDRQQKLN